MNFEVTVQESIWRKTLKFFSGKKTAKGLTPNQHIMQEKICFHFSFAPANHMVQVDALEFMRRRKGAGKTYYIDPRASLPW